VKETYIKPVFYYESFGLTQSIAKACEMHHTDTLGNSNHYSELTCEWDFDGETMFFITGLNADCDDGPDPEDEEFDFGGLCYNNPDGQGTIFSST